MKKDLDKIYKNLNEMISLSKRMGEPVKTGGFSVLIENMKLPFLIEEGLIKTYPTKSVVNSILKLFPNIDITSIEGENGTEKIKVETDDDFNEIEKVKYYMKKYGWILSENYYNEYIFEMKFDIEVSAMHLLSNGYEYIYHITTKTLLPRILKQGLVPKNKINGFIDDTERNYFYIDKPNEDKIKDFSIYKFNEETVLLKIDLNQLYPEFKFYKDPRTMDALFTYEPISKNCIKIIN